MLRKIILYLTFIYIALQSLGVFLPKIGPFSFYTYLEGILLFASLFYITDYNEIDILMLGFVILMFGSLLWVKNDIDIVLVKNIIHGIVTFVIIRNVVKTLEEIDSALIIFIMSVLLRGAFMLNSPAGFFLGRFGAGVNPNTASRMFEIALISSTYLISAVPSIAMKVNMILSSIILFFFTIITYSRTGILALFAVMIWQLKVMAPKKTFRYIIITILIISLPLIYYSRLNIDNSNDVNDTSLSTRIQLFINSVRLLPAYGIFGIGLGDSKNIISKSTPLNEKYPGQDFVAHNTYLTVWLELGILGIALFLAILMFAHKTENKLLKLLIIFFAISMFFIETLTFVNFWLVLALCSVSLKKRQQKALT